LLQKTKLSAAIVESIQRSALNAQLEPATDHVGVDAPVRVDEQGSANRASEFGDSDLSSAIGQPLAQLLKRPEITIEHLVPMLLDLAPELFSQMPIWERRPLPSAIRNELKSVETEIKYEGYLLEQQRAIERLKKAEQRAIPEWFNYASVSGLSREMQEKLAHIRPRTLAHASRIPGVTPAAVSLVNVYIEIQAKRREQVAAV